jgi:glycerol kinase
VVAPGREPPRVGVKPLLLGIDEGTTAVKAVLFDLDLRPVAQARRRVPVTHPRPGWVEKDPLAVLDAVVDAVGELLAGGHGEVVACGLDHEGESVLAWDAQSGAPLSPILVWQDKRSQALLAELDQDAVARRSGLPIDPYFSAGKLGWLMRHEPAVAAAHARGTLRLGTVDAFLGDRLGAGFATDPAAVSRMQLGLTAWDPWLCDTFGVPVAALPAIADSAGDLGELRHPSWPVALPLRARTVDQQAALAGSGCVRPGLVKATYGTGVFVLAHVGAAAPVAPPPGPAPSAGLLPTVAWHIGGRTDWALDGGVFTAGALLEWLSADLGLADDPAALTRLAVTVPGTGGVTVLPALAGLGAPWWRPDARGLIAGLTGATRPAHIARAALEAIAFRVTDVLEEVARHVPVDALRVDGGLTNDPLLLQLQADAGGVPVQRGLVDATAAGAAALAGVGAGLFALADIEQRIPAPDRVARPRTSPRDRRDAHVRWRRFVQAAAGVHQAAMSEEPDDIGAEGGDSDNADSLPPLPAQDDDSPLGDTDQHSSAPPTEHDRPRDPDDDA